MTKLFRDYDAAPPQVLKLYGENHRNQTLRFVLETKASLRTPRFGKFSIWKVIEMLDAFVDASDPDTENAQTQHALQSAEKARMDGQPRWMQLACLIHDLGKLLCLNGFEQWCVVGDTFPVGCAFDHRIVYSELFAANPDTADPNLSTKLGIYTEGCGLSNVHMSYGHDEYLYNIIKNIVPSEVSYVIRFHSFYAWHKEGAYEYLLDETDRRMLPHLKAFNKFDLYSKGEALVDVESVRDYYVALINEFFPNEVDF